MLGSWLRRLSLVVVLLVVVGLLGACSEAPVGGVPVGVAPDVDDVVGDAVVDPAFDVASLDVVSDDLIVVLDRAVLSSAAVGLSVASAAGGSLVAAFDHVGMMVVRPGDGVGVASVVDALLLDSRVLSVERDRGVVLWGGVDWGLDRINQRRLPLDGVVLSDSSAGAGVRVYVVDSGVKRDHPSLRGRVVAGTNVSPVGGPDGFDDCGLGHGTGVASKVAGVGFGVAVAATVVAVKAFECGYLTMASQVIEALDWVLGDAVARGGRSVANLSFGARYSAALNAAVERLVDAGVFVVVAAGNSNSDACADSPASALNAFTVAASTDRDLMASFSSWGRCVSLVAPGEDVLVASWDGGVWGSKSVLGTSFSAPLVAGVAARYLGVFGDASVFEVGNYVLGVSSPDVILRRALSGVARFPNGLLFVPVSVVRGDDGISGDFKCPFCLVVDASTVMLKLPAVASFVVPAGRVAEVRLVSAGGGRVPFAGSLMYLEERRGRLWWMTRFQSVSGDGVMLLPARGAEVAYRVVVRHVGRGEGSLVVEDVTHR
jgi:aqualysin 1